MEMRLVATHRPRVPRTLKRMRHILGGRRPKAAKRIKIAPPEPRPYPPLRHLAGNSAQGLSYLSSAHTHIEENPNLESKLTLVPDLFF